MPRSMKHSSCVSSGAPAQLVSVMNGMVQDAVVRASRMHGDTPACHFDAIVRALCLSDSLRHHIKLDNNATNLAARQAAGAAGQALAE